MCQSVKINFIIKFNILCMNAKNSFTAFNIRAVYYNLPVKTSRPLLLSGFVAVQAGTSATSISTGRPRSPQVPGNGR